MTKIPRNIKLNLTDKFILYFVLLYVLASGLVGGVSYYSSLNAIMERTFEQLTAVRVIKTRQIESFFTDRYDDINNLNKSLSELLVSSNIKNTILLNNHLSNFIKSNKYFDSYFLLDAGFNELSKNNLMNNVIDYSYIYRSIKKSKPDRITFFDFVKDSISNDIELFIITKIQSRNDSFYICLKIPIEFINKFMIENNSKEGLGVSGESYIVGSDLKMRSKSRFIEHSSLLTTVNTHSVIKAHQGLVGTQKIKDYRGIEVLSSYSRLQLKDLNWVLIAEIDYEEASIPIINLQRKLLLLGIFISSIVFVAVFYTTRRMIKPIKQLNEATKHISQGNFSDIIYPNANDEIGELAVSFNEMNEQLKIKDKELEEERKKRFSLVIDAQERERERVAKELHDGLGQMLIALKLKLETIDSKDSPNEETISDVKNYLDDTINDLRQISNNLMPAVLREFDFSIAITNLCNQFASSQKMEFNLESNLKDDIIDKKKKIYLYRIVQESLSNSIKHSKSQKVYIFLNEDPKNYFFTIKDFGIGFDYQIALKGNGNGLYNINERVNALAGSINIDSQINKGTTISLIIPK